jgi:hypothetical protein
MILSHSGCMLPTAAIDGMRNPADIGKRLPWGGCTDIGKCVESKLAIDSSERAPIV